LAKIGLAKIGLAKIGLKSTQRMRILVATLGSIGDLMPFLAVAEALRRRGHDVIVGSNRGYAALVQRAGFGFAIIWDGAPPSLDAVLERSPELAWAQVRRDLLMPAAEPTAAFIRHSGIRHSGGVRDCAVLASWSAFGAVRGCAQMNLPLYRVCLSPHAAEEPDDDPGTIRQQWLGFYPDWFGAPPPGRPGIRLTGFPALDDGAVPPLEPVLEDFLAAGPPPVVFTPGSFQRRAGRFFRECLAACAKLGLRAVLLSPYGEQVPTGLPAGVLHLKYAPLQQLAGRAAALVHHGGIGTLAQGLRSGVPQIAAPVFFDQFDNAKRLEALGVGRTLSAHDFCASGLAPLLEELTQSQAVRHRCRQIQARLEGPNPADTVCDLVESRALTS
jgi:hypothetical protein